MAPALRLIFAALRHGLERRPQVFEKVRLHFIGTDYAPARMARKTVEPIAREFGLGDRVREHPARVPYFEALQLLLSAAFLVVPGSDDPQYTASKIYPYILADKPLLAVFQPSSSVCGVLRETGAGVPLPLDAPPEDVMEHWHAVLSPLGARPDTDWLALAPFLAERMTERQCELFDRVLTGGCLVGGSN